MNSRGIGRSVFGRGKGGKKKKVFTGDKEESRRSYWGNRRIITGIPREVRIGWYRKGFLRKGGDVYLIRGEKQIFRLKRKTKGLKNFTLGWEKPTRLVGGRIPKKEKKEG